MKSLRFSQLSPQKPDFPFLSWKYSKKYHGKKMKNREKDEQPKKNSTSIRNIK